jgi:hypothetical protein
VFRIVGGLRMSGGRVMLKIMSVSGCASEFWVGLVE